MLSRSWPWSPTGFSHRSLFIKKLLTVKISNYFPALHESDNFKQGERYEVDEFKEYNFPCEVTFIPTLSLPRGARLSTWSDFHSTPSPSPAKGRATFYAKWFSPLLPSCKRWVTFHATTYVKVKVIGAGLPPSQYLSKSIC